MHYYNTRVISRKKNHGFHRILWTFGTIVRNELSFGTFRKSRILLKLEAVLHLIFACQKCGETTGIAHAALAEIFQCVVFWTFCYNMPIFFVEKQPAYINNES